MAKCNYIKVEVASQGCHLQTKTNGITDRDLNVMRSAPILDVMRIRLELMRLTGLCEKVMKEAGDVG
jgi:hypothetical protein|nr:MAG TPA: hypothetical protein [Caudoviricetes sp.]